MNIRPITAAALAVITLLAGVGASAVNADAPSSGPTFDGPVKIGLIMEQTGPLELLGQPSAVAGQAAVEVVNADDGIGGEPVEVEVCDTQSAPERALVCYDELRRKGIDIIIGPINTASGLAVLPRTVQDSVFFYPLSGSLLQADIDPNPFAFVGNVSTPDVLSAMFDWMRSEGLSDLSMMAQSGVISDPCRDALESDEYAEAREGIEVVSVVEFERDAQTVVPQLADIEGGDVLALCSAGTGTLVSMAGWDETGLSSDMLVVAPNSSQSDAFAAAAADRVQEVGNVRVEGYCTLLLRATPEQLGDEPPACYEEAQRYQAAVAEYAPGTAIDGLAATTWDAVRQTLEAVAAVGTEPEAITEYLEGLADWPGAAGPYTFGPGQHRGLGSDAIVIGALDGAVWVPVWFDGLVD